MTRLHVDDLSVSDGIVEIPKDEKIEGFNAGFYCINAYKLFTVLDKICPVFLTIGWMFYFFEDYESFTWSPYGTFMAFNFIDDFKNYIPCENATLTGFTSPSLLRMSVLKSFPNIFLRASVLPLILGRLFFLAILLSKWKRNKKNEKLEFVEPMTMAFATVELVSVAIFAATSSPLDSLYYHKTFGISFLVLTIFGFIVVITISIDLECNPKFEIAKCLFLCAGVFCISAPLALVSYFNFAGNRTCSPLVQAHMSLIEVLAMVSYIGFYWKAKDLIKNVELMVYSSKTELTEWNSRNENN